jgi:hypothetical protein
LTSPPDPVASSRRRRAKLDSNSLRDGTALESLRSLLVSHTLLFVGFSFADEAVNDQLKWLEATFQG